MFAVVDVETTGLDPRRGHRLVEVAVVQLDRQLREELAWDTLVNPNRNVGATEIHGLRFTDVEDAPTFEEIAGDLADLLDGRVLVIHNARFDVNFLRAEFQRAGFAFRPDALCTLNLADDLGLPVRLRDCCDALDVSMDLGHSALMDARATAALVGPLLHRARDAKRVLQFRPVSIEKGTLRRSGQRLPRTEPFRPDTHNFVANLIGRLGISPLGGVQAPGHAAGAYADLLDRVLEDRVITDEEASSLMSLASEWSLTADQVADIHYSYMTALVGLALRDGQLSRAERADLSRVARLLQVSEVAMDTILAGATVASRHLPALNRSSGFGTNLAGMTVHLVGLPRCSVGGSILGAQTAALLAAAAGLVVATNLTPAVDIVVVCDESHRDDIERAHAWGARVVTERVFWPTLGVDAS